MYLFALIPDYSDLYCSCRNSVTGAHFCKVASASVLTLLLYHSKNISNQVRLVTEEICYHSSTENFSYCWKESSDKDQNVGLTRITLSSARSLLQGDQAGNADKNIKMAKYCGFIAGIM